MNSPISAGDLCEVISGVLKEKSPNIGLIVEVLAYVGDDPAYGRIWRCQAEYTELWRDQDGANAAHPNKTPAGQADFAQDWLRKLPPKGHTKTTDTVRTKELIE